MQHGTSTSSLKLKARRFQLTLNEYGRFEELKSYLKTLVNLKYVIACHEVAPTTGHEHAHLFVCFSKTQTLCSSRLFGSHIERCMGSVQQNVDYIKKGGDIIWEEGEAPKGEANVDESWHNFIDQIHEGNVDKDSKMYAKYRHYAKERILELKPKKIYDGKLKHKNAWIWGPPGTGKSSSARFCDISHVYCKNVDKWWDGYDGQKVVIIDDFDPHMSRSLVNDFKKWTDRNPFLGEVKGAHIVINPADFNLIVTSNYSIDECFDYTDALAVKRRFTVMKFE